MRARGYVAWSSVGQGRPAAGLWAPRRGRWERGEGPPAAGRGAGLVKALNNPICRQAAGISDGVRRLLRGPWLSPCSCRLLFWSRALPRPLFPCPRPAFLGCPGALLRRAPAAQPRPSAGGRPRQTHPAPSSSRRLRTGLPEHPSPECRVLLHAPLAPTIQTGFRITTPGLTSRPGSGNRPSYAP